MGHSAGGTPPSPRTLGFRGDNGARTLVNWAAATAPPWCSDLKAPLVVTSDESDDTLDSALALLGPRLQLVPVS